MAQDLDRKEEPEMKVIKTAIYGVRSSGNQAERAVCLTAEKNIKQYPKAYDIIYNDGYVDDCISGAKLSPENGGFTFGGLK